MKVDLPLMKTVLKPLAKHIFLSLGLTAAATAADAGIHKKNFASGTKTFIISNKEMEDIMKIIKSLEESDLLIKRY